MELGLKGRTAVITGGSTGIGKAAARGLALEGVNLVLLARGQENLDKAASEIVSESSVEIVTIPTDMRNAREVNAAAATAAATPSSSCAVDEGGRRERSTKGGR